MPQYAGTITNQARQDGALVAPVGMIFPWPAPVGTALPTGYLLCDGSAQLIANYPEMYAVVGTIYGNGTQTPSGGSLVSSGFSLGTAFNLPDLRGTFLRGLDNMGGSQGAAGRDYGGRNPQASGGSSGGAGSLELDAIQGHAHEGWATGTETGGTGGPLYTAGAHNFGTMMVASQTDQGTGIAPKVAGESRPINMTCQFIVRVF